MEQGSKSEIDLSGVIFPEGLTDKDRELIVGQCEHQHATSPEQIGGMAEAYAQAKSLEEWPDEKTWEELIRSWAKTIESRNQKGWRKVEVRFANMSSGVAPDHLDDAMRAYIEGYAEKRMSADEAYMEFEKIHPLEDGNGRLGDLLWKARIKEDTGEWPERFPPEFTKERVVPYESAFGEIEE